MFQVPFPPNNNFVGRGDILAEIEAAIRKNQSTDLCVPIVLKGLGGMGKSQLMLKYCHTHRKDYKHVIWINAEGTLKIFEEFRNLAKDLGIKISKDKDLAKHIRTWFQSREERWLLMLDNLDTFEDVHDFIPHFGGDVIVTTRNHVNKSSGSVIRVDKMIREDALLLLLGPKIFDIPPEDAVRIVEELDCMPLAVDMVRAYIDRTDTSFKAYLELYNRKRAFLFKNEQDKNRNLYAHNIATVWDLSFKKLHERSRLASLIIGACAFLHSDAIPVSLFERQSTTLNLDADVDSIREAIGILVQFSFVRRSATHDVDIDGDNDYVPTRDLIAIHRLVQEIIRESIIKDVVQKSWGELLIIAMNNEVTCQDYHDPRVRMINDTYIPHIRNVVTQVDWHQMDSKTQKLLGRLMRKAAGYLRRSGTYQSGVEFALISVCISEAVDHPSTATSLNNLAGLYDDQGKYDEAEPLYKRALIIVKEEFGPDHPFTSKALNDLAGLYKNQGKYDEAEPLYQRALVIREKVLGPDHHETSTSLNNLAALYFYRGKYDKAEPLYQRALVIREKVLGSDHPETSTSLNNLAGLYDNQGKYDEAEPLYQRALAIKEKSLGPDHPETSIPLNNLAGLYKNQGKYDKAEPLYRRALVIFEKVLGPDHPKTSASLNNLAGLYDNQGKYDEAEPLYQRALVIRKKVLGSDHPETSASLNNLAGLYDNQGKYDEAEPLYRRALAIRKKVLGPDHPDTAATLNNLAALYEKQGKYDEAEPLYQQALVIVEKVLGSDHPKTLASLNNLALLYDNQGKYDVAKPLYQRALVIVEKALGPDHPSTSTLLNNLARLYFNRGKYDEAEPLYQRALVIREKVLGPDHPDTATSLSNLAGLYKNRGKYNEAESLYQRALEIREKMLGKDHPYTIESRETLSLLLSSTRKNRPTNGTLVILEGYWCRS